MHNNLRYAEESLLIESSKGELQNIVNRVHESSSQAGSYHAEKTKFMKIIRVPVQNEQEYTTVFGQSIENVKNFNLLGARTNDKSKKT